MKKDYKNYSLYTIIISIVFCVCSIGLDILYFKRNATLFSVGIAIGAAMIIANVVLLLLRLKKQNAPDGFYKRLMLIGMTATVISLSIPVIGILVLMFI